MQHSFRFRIRTGRSSCNYACVALRGGLLREATSRSSRAEFMKNKGGHNSPIDSLLASDVDRQQPFAFSVSFCSKVNNCKWRRSSTHKNNIRLWNRELASIRVALSFLVQACLDMWVYQQQGKWKTAWFWNFTAARRYRENRRDLGVEFGSFVQVLWLIFVWIMFPNLC